MSSVRRVERYLETLPHGTFKLFDSKARVEPTGKSMATHLERSR